MYLIAVSMQLIVRNVKNVGNVEMCYPGSVVDNISITQA